MDKRIFHVLLIIVVGLLVYSNTFNVPFHFDDINNIVANYKLKDLTNFWPPSGSRWLGYLTFALNYYFGELNVTGYHIVNLTIHIFNASLIYWLVVLTLRVLKYQRVKVSEYQSSEDSDTMTLEHSATSLIALFSALLFVSHPIQTQAVTYIVQRFTSLATMFYLLSLIMYIKWRESRGQRAEGKEQKIENRKLHATRYTLYAVSLVSAVLAMKTKETSFTLPIIIVLYEFMFFEGNIKKRILYLLPLLFAMLIIPLSLIGIDKPIGDVIGEMREVSQETEQISRWSYLFTQFRVIVTYTRLLAFPINQNFDYDYTVYHSFLNPNVFLSFLFLLLIFGFGIYLSYSKRYKLYATRLTAFGIFWFFITLSVESSIIPIRDVINEHRLYLPSIGLVVAFTTSVFYVLQFIGSRRRFAVFYSVPTLIIFMALITITLSIAAYQRNTVWKDAVSLWGDAAAKSPNKARPNYELGVAYGKLGDENAFYYMKKAKQLNAPFFYKAMNLAENYRKQRRFDEAIKEYQRILKTNPTQPKIRNNLGLVYYEKGLLGEAVKEYGEAIKLDPKLSVAHYNLGLIYFDMGLIKEAIKEYREAIMLDPQDPEPHAQLGIAYTAIGLLDDAVVEFKNALKINPQHANAKNSLDYVLSLKKN
ncbi:MAG: tetratricopeptide repeat protein [Nitrospirae bacterium]|nr:tetratricopeptide repeat protein [Nitrospirota bacterium]